MPAEDARRDERELADARRTRLDPRRSRPLSAALLAILVTLSAPPARAQNVAVADALFKKGLAEMQAGRFDTGCPALAESYRIDPQLGSLFTLAECHAKAGHVATARARYDDYLQIFASLTPEQQKRQFGRERIAATKKAELSPRVPTVTVTLSSTAPSGTRVTCDDLELKATSLGVPLPLDPGDHTFRAAPPSGAAVEERLTLSERESRTITLNVAAPKEAPPPPKPKAAPAPSGLGARRIGAIIAGGVGLAGLGAGVAFGALTLRKRDVIEQHCTIAPGQPDICDTTGVSAHNDALTMGWVSTGGFILGGLGLGAAATLFFLKAPEPRPAGAGAAQRAPIAAAITSLPGGAKLVIEGVF